MRQIGVFLPSMIVFNCPGVGSAMTLIYAAVPPQSLVACESTHDKVHTSEVGLAFDSHSGLASSWAIVALVIGVTRRVFGAHGGACALCHEVVVRSAVRSKSDHHHGLTSVLTGGH